MDHFKFVQNRSCEYFPCHKDVSTEEFNCLFCYCPLYVLGENCGGSYSYTSGGIKDCSACLRPHRREGYDDLLCRLEELQELAKKRE